MVVFCLSEIGKANLTTAGRSIHDLERSRFAAAQPEAVLPAERQHRLLAVHPYGIESPSRVTPGEEVSGLSHAQPDFVRRDGEAGGFCSQRLIQGWRCQ